MPAANSVHVKGAATYFRPTVVGVVVGVVMALGVVLFSPGGRMVLSYVELEKANRNMPVGKTSSRHFEILARVA